MAKLGTQVDVNSTTPERLVGFDPERTSLVFVKQDNGILFINTDIESTTAAEGFPIRGSGGNLSINDLFGSDPTIEYYGIVSAGTGDVRVLRSRSPILALVIRVIKFFMRGKLKEGPFD